MSNTLKSNFAYANKLASATNNFLESAMQQLAYSAKKIEQNIDDNTLLQAEVTRLNRQTNSFNSVIINKYGIISATSPELPLIIDQPLSSPGATQAFKERRPLISDSYMSKSGNLIVFISHPLFSSKGDYLGYIGGSLYLKERSILNDLLEHHYFEGGTHIYVVDTKKRILYHPDSARIGTFLANNKVINQVLMGNDGIAHINNSQNIHMLAGYAPVKLANYCATPYKSNVKLVRHINNCSDKTYIAYRYYYFYFNRLVCAFYF